MASLWRLATSILLLAAIARATVCPQQTRTGCTIGCNGCPSGWDRNTDSCGFFSLGCRTTCTLNSCCSGWTGSGCNTPICASNCQNGACTVPGGCTPCQTGWSGANCEVCSRRSGCQFGTCNQPNECNCNSGWGGSLCNTCVPKSGCRQGRCNSPGECICQSGWSGELCDTAICTTACGNGACTAPGVCTCNSGWLSDSSGSCNIAQKNPSCVQGTSGGTPFGCVCNSGWSGPNCDQAICRAGCSPSSGSCLGAPNTCTCSTGWTGTNCDQCVVRDGCVAGTCTRPGECSCRQGYSGALCNQAVCTVGCQRGTCSVPGTCVCEPGWSGPLCSTPVCSNCDTNYGACTGPNTCTCSPGWNPTSGCAAPICREGCRGSCTRPGGCDCAAGYTGLLCDTPVCSNCQNGVCVAPNSCTCNATLWTGTGCSTPVCQVGCTTRSCQLPGTCDCTNGQFYGPQCNLPICRAGCALTKGGTCSTPGTCVCAQGWTGANCDVAICAAGCNNVSGSCSLPGRCDCASGWTGPLCNQLICAAGCSADNGFCTQPGTCQCRDPTRWTGAFCNTPVCRAGCLYGTCTTPGQCLCSSNYTGTLCDTPVCASCVRGTCILPGVCQCESGWTGSDCSIAVCRAGCSPTYGSCFNSPGNCTCATDAQGVALWTGPQCTVPICTAGCQRGICTQPRRCDCSSGWTGELCDTAKCRDGCSPDYGSCVNKPFGCDCAPGWSGAFCTTDINECLVSNGGCSQYANCANSPPGSLTCTCIAGFQQVGSGLGAGGCVDINECSINNGNCSQICNNTIGSFTCSCQPGYQGNGVGPAGCQNINECATSVTNCASTATCIDLVGSYACQCSPGYTGNGVNCTDVDECGQGLSTCSAQSSGCINTPGSFTCGPCFDGYSGNGFVCNPVGSIFVQPDTLLQTAQLGSQVFVNITSQSNGAASVRYTVTGLAPSDYTLTAIPSSSLNATHISFAASTTVTLSLTNNLVSQVRPQTNLTIALSQPSGAALTIAAPAAATITVQATNAPAGVVLFSFPEALNVVPNQPQLVFLNRVPPSPWTDMPALAVAWQANTQPPVSGTVLFDFNSTTAVINLTVPNDGIPRLGYTAVLQLLPTNGVTLGLVFQRTLLVPDSNQPNGYLGFALASTLVAQGSTTRVTVTRANGKSGAISVLASCVPGTATTLQYSCPATVLSWAADDSAQQSFDITIYSDDVPRLQSWFLVKLQAPTGGAVLNANRSTSNISIAESSSPFGVAVFSQSSTTVEINNIVIISATRLQGVFGAVQVQYQITCPNSYISLFSSSTGLATGTLRFPAGVSQSSTFVAVGNTNDFFDYITCNVSFVPGSARNSLQIGNSTMSIVVTAYPNNPFGVFSLDTAALAAVPSPLLPGTSFPVTVLRNISTIGDVRVQLSVANDPGFQLSFRPESGIVTFAANQGLQTLFCTVLAPRTPQPITTFSLVLSIDSTYEAGFTDGAAIGAGTWSGVLEASGAPAGVLAFPSRSVTAAVGTTVNVVLARNGSTTAAVAINYTITAPSTATLNVTDVGAGMVSFASGQRTASISLTLANSSLPTLQQQLIVTLGTSNTTDAFVSTRSTCVVTVQPNNLPYGLFSMGAPATTMVNKMLGGVVNVPVVRGAGALGAATVTLAVSGNATARQDYTLTPSTLSFAAGQVSATAQLQLVNNGQPSLVETAVVTVTSVQPSDGLLAGVAAGSSVTVVVQAANGVYGVFGLVGPANSTVAAGPTPIVNMTVVRTGGLTGAVRVRFGQNNVQAVAGLNYVLLQPNGQSPATPSPTSFVDFADGQANATISIMLISRPSLTPTRRSVESPSLALQLYSCAVWNPFNGDYEINPGCTVNAGQPTQLNVISNCVAYGCTNVASCDEAWPAPRCNCASGFTGSTCGSAASTAGSSSSSSIIPIIVAVCGGIILLVIIVLLVRRHRNRTKTSNSSLVATFNADPGARPAVFVNPTFSDSTAQSIYYSEVGPGGAPVPHPYNRLRPNSGSNMQNNFAESTTDAPTPQGYFDVQPSEENPVYTLGREPSLRHYSLGMSGDATMYPIVPGGDYSSPASTAYAQAGAADAGYREVTPMAGARGGSARDANKGLDGGYMAAQAANSYAPVVPVGAAGSYMAVQAGGGAGSYMAVQPGAGAASYMAVQPADFAVPTADGGYLSTRALAGSDGGYMAAGALQQSGSDGGYLVTRPAPGMDAGYAAVGSFAVPTSDGGYMTTRPALAADTGYAAVSPVTGSGAYAAVHPATTGYAMLPGAASGEELAYDEVRIFNGGSVQAKPAGLWRDEWVYPPLGRAEVDAALYSGGKEDGRFLVREKEKGVYALSVIHMGAVCHHLLVRDKSGWHVNGFEVPHCKSLGDVVEYLRVPRLNVNQPQALTAPVHK